MQNVQRAMALHQSGKLAEAERLYREILAAEPNRFEAVHFLGVLCAQQGRLADAEALMARSLKLNATVPDAFVNYARILAGMNRPDDAMRNCDRALALNPRNPAALIIRGNALRALSRPGEALADLRNALSLDPRNPVAQIAHGEVLRALKRPAEALASYQQAVMLAPGNADAWHVRGLVLGELGRKDEAAASHQRAVAIKPDFAEAWRSLAMVLFDLRRHREVLDATEKALATKPDAADVWCCRGAALHSLARHEEAFACYEKALTIRPGFADALYNRGNALHELERFDEALIAFEQALAVDPNHVDTLFARGTTLHEQQRLGDALASFAKAAALAPARPDIQWNESAALLAIGEFKRGFAKHEWRWQVSEHLSRKPMVRAADWRGEDLRGRRLLVFTEQGMGDVIQFARYLPMLRDRGADVTFHCDARLVRLLAPLTKGIRVTSQLAMGEAYDFRCGVLDLPHGFGTDRDSIPAAVPYLAAEPERVAHWRNQIGTAGFKVGIVWQGNPQGKVDHGRSIPLEHYVPLTCLPGVRIISLQKHHGLDQIARLPAGTAIENLGPSLDNGPDWYVDAAAAMMALDLIVTSDTSMAHLAGALGRPTFVALKFVPDWRWMLDRDDSPWYPTMRLFRQPRRGDWSAVFAAIERELRTRLSSAPAI